MIESDDRFLVSECLKGSQKAFEQVVDKYQKPLFNVAYRLTGNRNDAEEVTQVAFIKAFEKLHTFNKESKFFSWIYRIAVNESLNFRNARKHHDPISDVDGSKYENPETLYQERETEEHIQYALGKIKEEYRAVIVLRHLQGLSYDDISKILDVPAKTVKSRLFSARQLLRDILIKQI
jgi:RNA polymerase sigma-70 factor (ECF subfamily)